MKHIVDQQEVSDDLDIGADHTEIVLDQYLDKIKDILLEGQSKGFVTKEDIKRHMTPQTLNEVLLEKIYDNLRALGIDIQGIDDEDEKKATIPLLAFPENRSLPTPEAVETLSGCTFGRSVPFLC